MMYNLMVNPSIEEKLVKEVSSLLSEDETIAGYENIKQFQYTQATFYETLRLHPSVPNNFKVTFQNKTLYYNKFVHMKIRNNNNNNNNNNYRYVLKTTYFQMVYRFTL